MTTTAFTADGGAPRILLTGFAPFAGESVNPSAIAVAALAARAPVGVRLATEVLPVSYRDAVPPLLRALRRHAPDVVLALGLAGGRPHVSVERVAINIDDARIPDNDGIQRIDTPVVPGGPAAYFATIPVKATVAALRAAGVPAEVSQTAGTFLCNHVFYRACHAAATEHPGLRVGFLHVPWLPEQAVHHPGEPSLALATLLPGLTAVLAALRDGAAEPVVAEGAIS